MEINTQSSLQTTQVAGEAVDINLSKATTNTQIKGRSGLTLVHKSAFQKAREFQYIKTITIAGDTKQSQNLANLSINDVLSVWMSNESKLNTHMAGTITVKFATIASPNSVGAVAIGLTTGPTAATSLDQLSDSDRTIFQLCNTSEWEVEIGPIQDTRQTVSNLEWITLSSLDIYYPYINIISLSDFKGTFITGKDGSSAASNTDIIVFAKFNSNVKFLSAGPATKIPDNSSDNSFTNPAKLDLYGIYGKDLQIFTDGAYGHQYSTKNPTDTKYSLLLGGNGVANGAYSAPSNELPNNQHFFLDGKADESHNTAMIYKPYTKFSKDFKDIDDFVKLPEIVLNHAPYDGDDSAGVATLNYDGDAIHDYSKLLKDNVEKTDQPAMRYTSAELVVEIAGTLSSDDMNAYADKHQIIFSFGTSTTEYIRSDVCGLYVPGFSTEEETLLTSCDVTQDGIIYNESFDTDLSTVPTTSITGIPHEIKFGEEEHDDMPQFSQVHLTTSSHISLAAKEFKPIEVTALVNTKEEDLVQLPENCKALYSWDVSVIPSVAPAVVDTQMPTTFRQTDDLCDMISKFYDNSKVWLIRFVEKKFKQPVFEAIYYGPNKILFCKMQGGSGYALLNRKLSEIEIDGVRELSPSQVIPGGNSMKEFVDRASASEMKKKYSKITQLRYQGAFLSKIGSDPALITMLERLIPDTTGEHAIDANADDTHYMGELEKLLQSENFQNQLALELQQYRDSLAKSTHDANLEVRNRGLETPAMEAQTLFGTPATQTIPNSVKPLIKAISNVKPFGVIKTKTKPDFDLKDITDSPARPPGLLNNQVDSFVDSGGESSGSSQTSGLNEAINRNIPYKYINFVKPHVAEPGSLEALLKSSQASVYNPTSTIDNMTEENSGIPQSTINKVRPMLVGYRNNTWPNQPQPVKTSFSD